MMANKKLGDSSAILTGTERIGELLQEMSDQQQQVESLRSYFLKSDEEFDLENYRIKS
jgi:hypothetical protein